MHNFQSKSSFLPRYLSKIKANRRLNEHPPAYIDFFSIFFFRAPRRAGGSRDSQGPTPNAGEGGKVAGDASEGARAAARWSIAAR